MGIESSIMDAIQNDKVQNIAGFLLYGQKAYGDGAINGTIRAVEALISDPHIPDFGHIMRAIKADGVIKNLVLVGIGGWIAEEVNVHPQVTRIGKIAKGFSVNATIGALLGYGLNYAGLEHSDGGSRSSGSEAPTLKY